MATIPVEMATSIHRSETPPPLFFIVGKSRGGGGGGGGGGGKQSTLCRKPCESLRDIERRRRFFFFIRNQQSKWGERGMYLTHEAETTGNAAAPTSLYSENLLLRTGVVDIEPPQKSKAYVRKGKWRGYGRAAGY